MRHYLKDLGASAVSARAFTFSDAEVLLTEAAPQRVGSLIIGRLEVVVNTDSAEREATLVAGIRLKALSGGG